MVFRDWIQWLARNFPEGNGWIYGGKASLEGSWGSHTSNVISVTTVLPLLEIHINRIVHYLHFCVWLLSLSIMILGFIHAVLDISSYNFLLLNSTPLYEYTTCVYLINSWRTFALLPVWAVPISYESSVMNIEAQILCGHVFSFLLGGHLGVKLVGHVMNICFSQTPRLSSPLR